MHTLEFKRSAKHGLDPGSLTYVGRARSTKISFKIIYFNEQSFEQKAIFSAEECRPYLNKEGGVLWLDIEGVHDAEQMKIVGEVFHLHPLLMEDVLNTTQRPKFDEYDETAFVVLKMLTTQPSSGHFLQEQVSFVIGRNFVISFQEGIEGDCFNGIRNRLPNPKYKARKLCSDYLLFLLIDSVIDEYFCILDMIETRFQELEKIHLSSEESNSLPIKYYKLKTDLLDIRKVAGPLREITNKLDSKRSNQINEHTDIYFRDIHDHTIQIVDNLEMYREMLTELQNIYISGLSLKMNDIMKFLTIFSVIFIPLTFIVGVYGMNFEFMPELHQRNAYWIVWGVMIMISAGMILYFRRKKWL